MTSLSKKPAKKPVSIYMTAKEHREMLALSKRLALPYSVIVRKLVVAYAKGEIAHDALPRIAVVKLAPAAVQPA